MDIREVLKKMVEVGASDVYLRTNAAVRVRVMGEIQILDEELVTLDDITAATNFLLENEARRKEFLQNLDIDFVHQEPNVGRFRVNIFMQRGTPAIVARYVHTHIRSFEDLNLPADFCRKFCHETKGMFLVCGPAGNGKSTTLAAMIDYINSTSANHIITIEDPIEFLFQDKKSLINQRELGLDVPSYVSALKHVTQQSPDIIYIGNIRDEETMKAALTATQLGAFVLSTFHTVNAVQTIIRIVNFFPPYLHDEIRLQLSMVLKGIISLRLLPTKDRCSRVPAYETMAVTPTIARLIREGRIREIQNYIDEGELFGMVSFKKSLVSLVKSGLVSEDLARQYADSQDDFNVELKGIKRSLY